MMKKIDILVIGAGQAGLSLGYYLQQQNVSFLLIDSSQNIGDIWRYRYDSLVLYTPRFYSALPGLRISGDQWDYPTKDEIADYLADYQRHFSIPVSLNTNLYRMKKTATGFLVETSQGEFEAQKVVIATGPFQNPYIPSIAENLSNEIYQIHTSSYHNPSQLPEGPVLVIGGGSSGGQIAVECSKDREVYLAISSKINYLPYKFLGRNLFWWYDKLGLLKKGPETILGKRMKGKPDPMYGFILKKLVKSGAIKVKPRAIEAMNDEVEFADQTKLKIKTIVWATGFISDYSWVEIPELFDYDGKVIQDRGISNVPGLYFLGLPWQTSRGSGLIGWVGRDAKFISEQVVSSHAQQVQIKKEETFSAM
ncbi:flavin-containing monooxygenase [Peribacillus frigoritolerans]|uniref:flavin-containing monooxygenase n=1 Tax=Peribacillus frigoritolerans TaxID=450367 RepID=UPI003812D5F1